MKSFFLFPIAFFLLVFGQKTVAQSPIQFTVCPKMWSTGAAVKVDFVEMQIKNPSFPVASMVFPATGADCIEITVPTGLQNSGSTYHFEGLKDETGLNGITMNDVWELRLHILGIKPFGSPFPILASDINNSFSMTTFDLVLIQKKLLGLPDNGQFSWHSLPGYWDFSLMIPNPFNNPACCQNLSLAELATFQNDSMDLVFYKKGDVDGDADPQLDNFSPNFTETARLGMGNQQFAAGETKTVGFASQIAGQAIGAFQFELEFDPAKLEILGVESTDFAVQFEVSGKKITLLGINLNGSTVVPGDLFKIKAKAKVAGFAKDFLALKPEKLHPLATVGEVGDTRLATLALSIVSKTGDVENDFSGLKIYPNPAGAAGTLLFFDSKILEDTRLIVSDLTGKTVFEKPISVLRGENKIEIPAAAIPAGGVCFFQFILNGKVVAGRLLGF